MLVIPAIDIRAGRCVRLLQGDPDRETVYSDDPVSTAKRFEAAGAQLIHVVDLDGAFTGTPVNHGIVAAIAGSVSIPIEIGGGIRNTETIELYLSAGIRRIILGTAVAEDGAVELLSRYRDYIVAGVDARDSKVAVEGWRKVSEISSLDVIKSLHDSGLKEFIYTDISTDGMLGGPNFGAFGEILDRVPGISLIASGGVSSIDDIIQLARYTVKGLKGCIVGKAIYDGRIDLREALRRVESLPE